MGKTGKPFLPNLQPLIASGILKSKDSKDLKADVKRFLRLIDEQDAVNRYVWYNLPCDITSQEVERLLYYRGNLCFFYYEELGKFFFMPYAGKDIDFYSRFKTVWPVPISTGTEKAEKSELAALLKEKQLTVVYGINTEIPDEKMLKNCTVLLQDYTRQLAQTIIPREQINDPLLDVMAECVPMARTSRLLSTGITGIRVEDEDASQNVVDGNRRLEDAALSGDAYIPIVGHIEFQELNGQTPAKGEEFMLAMQSLDNLRLSGYGIDNGGLFEKKAHELQTEADINGGPVGLVLQDGLSIRQNFCNIVNSIWGLGIWCEPAENIMGADANGDGMMYDRNEGGENSGISDQEGDQQND